MFEREYTSRRGSILMAVTDVLKQIDGTGDFLTNLAGNVQPKLQFWDEVAEFPTVNVSIGTETRLYQAGGYKDRFLTMAVRCYVKDDESWIALERLLTDIETVIEQNGRLAYQEPSGATNYTQDITVASIDTDGGTLSPLGVGEILLQVRY